MRWRRIGRRRWRSVATDTSRSRASPGRSSPRCSAFSARTPRRMPAETAPAKATTADTGKILVVDDHEDNIEVLRVRLEHWGYETTSARSGNEALEMVRREPPDLILLAVMMPEVSGIDVAREIKGDKSLPFIPIIMQTALDSTENKVEGLEAGADDYIQKPIDFAELRARLRSVLRLKRPEENPRERGRGVP